MAGKAQHVVANTSGGWSVRKSGAARATRNFATQAEARKYASEIAKREATDVYVHEQDGTVKSHLSFAPAA